MKLEDKELKIINHYGVEAQLDYFPTEIYELVDAIKDYECYGSCFNNEDAIVYREHVIEELSDCEMMLDQFKLKFEYKESKEFNVYPGNLPDAMKYLFKDVGRFIQKVAIHEYEAISYDEPSEFLIEAIKNVQEKLNFFKACYVIDQKLIDIIKERKADRQLSRIKENSKR